MARGGAHNVKPTAIRLLTGNPGKGPINDAEPQPSPVVNLNPPSWLDRYGKQAWKEHALELDRMGLLTVADLTTLALFCDAYSQLRHALDDLKLMSAADENYRALCVTREKARADMRLFAGEFGLTPKSRAGLAVKVEKTTDEMEGLLGGRNTG
jgi:P27 family predicted phage terminase small subunit